MNEFSTRINLIFPEFLTHLAFPDPDSEAKIMRIKRIRIHMTGDDVDPDPHDW